MDSNTVLGLFSGITRIPRESGREEKITAYLADFAKTHDLECRIDESSNVVIVKPAAPGYENVPAIVLQSHSDMVCEKRTGSTHNFETDPIEYVIRDGWMIAEDTTLGADCGIGIAAELAVLLDERPTGRIECLFTASEETGMYGAFGLKEGFISGKTLLNLDSEDEGELFVGCAGGIDTTAVFTCEPKPVPSGAKVYRIKIYNGVGGHSGDDINKERANAVQLLARFLYDGTGGSGLYHTSLCSIDGGNKRNAIAREAEAVVAVQGDSDAFERGWAAFEDAVKAEYAVTEPDLAFSIEPSSSESCFDSDRLVAALFGAPHGVLAMSCDIPGLVETSSNLASVKMLTNNQIRVGTSQRSSVDSERRAAAAKVEAVLSLAGAEVTHESEYPGWKPNMDSHILKVCTKAYRKRFGYDAAVKAIHAGLECGLFLEKFPDLDMISFGPTLRGVHAPGERLDLKSLDKFVLFLDDVIRDFTEEYR